MENLNEDYQDVFGNFELSQDEKVERYLETFDIKSLERVKKKQLSELTEEDLLVIGLEKFQHEDFDEIYSCRDFSHLKKYISKAYGVFELRGYLLKKEKGITSTQELIDEAFLKWRLKMKEKKQDSFLVI